MSTRPTFEDRLLDELKREIELREPEPNPSARRLFTPRRIALAAAACALAGLAVVFVPGSAADSKAYAVERNGDGSVTLTVKDHRGIDIDAQQELAGELRPWGVKVAVALENVDRGDTCTSWGDDAVLELRAVTKQGIPVPVRSSSVTLHRGSTLVLANKALTKDEVKSHMVKSCVPVKPTPSDD
ncbi:hypothetical protein ACFYO0_25300 [Streptomyces sp. NPDC006365]|uniref:hypothetical protein n=1 Tax=Streptomyces sp. NPDC006365 TaxID=3364744 RepID=UPI0036BF26D4